jgi:CheY-like chemotaxis protein
MARVREISPNSRATARLPGNTDRTCAAKPATRLRTEFAPGRWMSAILFVSSNPIARERWCQALRHAGRDAVVLAPGLDTFLRATTPLAAIVVDVDLAADWQYFRLLGEEKRRLMAPLIVLTSWGASDGGHRQHAFDSGCDAFVSKPCTPDALLDVIARLASGERRIQISAAVH